MIYEFFPFNTQCYKTASTMESWKMNNYVERAFHFVFGRYNLGISHFLLVFSSLPSAFFVAQFPIYFAAGICSFLTFSFITPSRFSHLWLNSAEMNFLPIQNTNDSISLLLIEFILYNTMKWLDIRFIQAFYLHVSKEKRFVYRWLDVCNSN